MTATHAVRLGLATALLAGCGAMQTDSAPVTAGPEIALLSGGLLRGADGGPEIGVTLQNRSSSPLALEVSFLTPGSTQNCVHMIELAGGERAALFCPQPRGVVADQDYTVRALGYTDPDAIRPVATAEATVRFHSADVAGFPPPRPSAER